jgi:hypothetical protein
MFFNNRACEVAANILAAQCKDLGMTQIDQYADGTVSARLRGTTFHFAWDVQKQSARMIERHPPRVELAA